LPERDGYIAGVPCWIDTTQPDPDAAASFYTRLFGWEFENAMPAGESAKYLIGRIRGGDVAAISSRDPEAEKSIVILLFENKAATTSWRRRAGHDAG